MATLETTRFVSFGPFRFDGTNRLLTREGAEVPLPPRVVGVLECLLERPGTIVSRQEIIERVWRDAFVTDTSLAEAISFLRQALGDDPQAPAFIQTFHRRGYRFVAPVPGEEEPVTRRAPHIAETDGHEQQAEGPSVGVLVPWSLCVVLAAILGVAIWKVTRPPTAGQPQVARFEVALAPGTALRNDRHAVAVSPDGQSIAVSACDASGCRLFIRELRALTPRALEGTEGAAAPFFAPDGRSVGFFADGKLKKVPLAGGAPIVLCDAPDPLGAAWLDDGRIVFAAREAGGLEVVAESGGLPSPFTRVDVQSGDVGHRWPNWIAGSEHLVFIASPAVEGALPGRALVVRADGSAAQVVTGRATGAQFLSPELLVFARGTELYAARFDRRRRALSTAPLPIARGFATAEDGAPQLAVSPRGALLISPADPAAVALQPPPRTASAAWIGWTQLRSDPMNVQVAGINAEALRTELWVADRVRGTTTRLTRERAAAVPRWTPDGRALVFGASSGGAFNLWRADVNGGIPRRLATSRFHQFPSDVAHSGAVVFTQIDDQGRGDVWLLAVDGRARPLVQSPFDERGGVLSADERLLVYESDESGFRQVYVRAVDGTVRHVVSPGGGRRPLWQNGRVLYRNDRGTWEVAIGRDLTPGIPRAISESPGIPGGSLTRLHLTLEAWQEISRALPPPVDALPR